MEVIKQSSLTLARSYNEAEVRFHIVDPILRKLGYADRDDDVYLYLEEKLEYPFIHIGGRSKKDLPLGFPDYRAGLKGARGSFIVEAKAGLIPITKLEVEQAHSYAAHAQVGANYFVLCNGIEICVYETLSGPTPPPLAVIRLHEVNSRFHELENILEPGMLARNCKITYDSKLRLCNGLGSSVRFRDGVYDIASYAFRFTVNGRDCTEAFKSSNPQIALLDQQLEFLRSEFELRVLDGSAERDAEGRISLHAQFQGVTKNNLYAMRLLNLDRLSLATNEEFISRDARIPTVFEATNYFQLEKGTMLPQLFGAMLPLEANLKGEIFVRADMYICKDTIHGEYLALTNHRLGSPTAEQVEIELALAGRLEISFDA